MTTDIRKKRQTFADRLAQIESDINVLCQTMSVHLETGESRDKFYAEAIQKMIKLEVYCTKAFLLGIESQQRIEQLETLLIEKKMINGERIRSMNEGLKERLAVIEERIKEN